MADLHVMCSCGWETRGTEEVVVAATQAHGRDLHNMDASKEQVLAMAMPAPAAERARRGPEISGR
jgi:predicted small metal-binding protein